MVIPLFKWLFLFSGFMGNPDKPAHPVLHPLYISVTEINHNATDKNLEISCKIFADDLEKTIGSVYNKKVDLANPSNKAEAEKLVTGYIKSHLLIKLDGKPVTLEYVGYENENEAVWSYFQVPNTANAPKKIEITNSILFETYDKEINLMHVSVGGNRKSTRLNYPDKDAKFEF
jgi:hypothetical protein